MVRVVGKDETESKTHIRIHTKRDFGRICGRHTDDEHTG